MKPVLKLASPSVREPRAEALAAAAKHGLTENRKQALRALEETREAIQSGQLLRSGEAAAKELENALTGKPEAGEPGVIMARVVASSVAKEKLPPVPLAGLQVQLRIKEEILRL